MRIRPTLVLAALLALPPAAAHATGPSARARAAAHARQQAARQAAAEARLERVEDRIKTMRALALANRLNLDPATALKLNAIMEKYDGKRAQVRQGLRAAMKQLQQAAHTKAPDAATVGTAVQQVLAAQAQLADLRAQEAREMMQGLTPWQTARLMLFYRDFPREIRRLLRRAEHLRRLRGPAPPTATASHP